MTYIVLLEVVKMGWWESLNKMDVEKFEAELKRLVEKIQNNKRNKYYYVMEQKYWGLSGATTLEIYTSYNKGKLGMRIFKYSTDPFATVEFNGREYRNTAEVHETFGMKIYVPEKLYDYAINGSKYINPQAPAVIYKIPKELIIQLLQSFIN